MKTSKTTLVLIIVTVALLLASCGSAPSENNRNGSIPADNNSVTPPAGDSDQQPEEGDPLPPLAAIQAREALAETLGIQLASIEIINQEQIEWSDSCLGLGGPAESCLAVITPGWRVELSAEESVYLARTDELGEVIRFEDLETISPGLPLPTDQTGSTSDDSVPQAALIARESLANRLGVSVQLVEIISVDKSQWSDSCLGLGGPAESCLAVITPGWRVELSLEGELYIARTDEPGDQIRFEDLAVNLPVVPPVSQPPADGSLPEAVLNARQLLANRLNLPLEKVEVVSYAHTDWPDGCLGLPSPGMMCTMAIVPGWRVELSADGQSFIARTNETGSLVKFE
ncbi:MAG: hypothetical protein JW757_09690 [Anaerolineales bacterium]|nr:hypothetical protein [Anaerolineales bacterium]